jgi:type I secretion outer membrane protein, TolC family
VLFRPRHDGKVAVIRHSKTTGAKWLKLAALSGTILASCATAQAETMSGALAKAYENNPSLNVQRAQVRITDENVPRAKGGWRPTITAQGTIGAVALNSRTPNVGRSNDDLFRRTIGIEVQQMIFDSGRTLNNVRASESQVFSARETLRNAEQSVLLDGVIAYMNVLRDTAVYNLQTNNVEVLQEQLRQTKDRFDVGEVTRTDVAQAEAALAAGRAQQSVAQANLRASIATYRQVIGVEPRKLGPGVSAEKYLPKTVDQAVALGLQRHPAIASAQHSVDTAELQVKATEAQLLPDFRVAAGVSQSWDQTISGDRRTSASIIGTLNVPIYEGGVVYAQTRQAKETAGQARIQVDLIRDQVRQQVIATWSQLEAAKQQITAAQAQVEANQVALEGVREEAKVGQRTTLDVLNAQQALLNSRVELVTAQRDRIVASYGVLSAVGRLSAPTLGLRVATYDPKIHFEQVKDKWIGLDTPSGK